ncbi:unnamed protein product, partial [Polarella glacialis]
IEFAADAAYSQGRNPNDEVDTVLKEAGYLAQQGLFKPRSEKQAKQLQQDIQKNMDPDDLPTLFPHYRKAIDWDERNGTEAAPKLDAPDHFFSKKSWSQVFGVTDMGARLAQRLNLPRPSRVQNMTFYDVQEGLNVLIADQSGSGKTLAYMLPLFQRYVLGQPEDEEHLLKLVVLVPTSDLAEQTVAVAKS